MIQSQTRNPDLIYHMNYAPESKSPDLTQRVRRGFELAKKDRCDVVFVMENDDYYHPDYIAFMLMSWFAEGMPEIFGLGHSLYYHIKNRKYHFLLHKERASLMNTLVSCSAQINWPKDSEVFLDICLWRSLNGKTILTDGDLLSIGIKHGIGKCGGIGHTVMKYDYRDADLQYLKSNTGEMFTFYSKLAKNLRGN